MAPQSLGSHIDKNKIQKKMYARLQALALFEGHVQICKCVQLDVVQSQFSADPAVCTRTNKLYPGEQQQAVDAVFAVTLTSEDKLSPQQLCRKILVASQLMISTRMFSSPTAEHNKQQ